MRVLVACEISGIVRNAFTLRGHEAWICDIQPAQLGIYSTVPVNHYQCDVLEILGNGWDLMIAHPPCTYLSYAANGYWNRPGRWEKRIASMEFVRKIWNAPIKKICMENPLGIISREIPYSQIIHPYYFNDPFIKRTCLWLKGLPKLIHQNPLPKPKPKYVSANGKNIHWSDAISGSHANRSNLRSKTFPSIAEAMANQWG